MAEIKLEDTPKKVRDLYGKAFASFERGNYDYALIMFSKVLEMEPGLLMARRFMRSAELKQCKDNDFNHSMNSLKGMGTMMKLKGALKKDPLKALEAGEKLMRIDPLNLSFLQAYTEAAMAAEMPEAALLTLELALEHHPEDIKLLNLLGKTYAEAGLTTKARECFEEVYRLRPDDMEAVKAMKDSAALDTLSTGRWDTDQDYREILKDSEEAERLEQAARANKSGSDIERLIAEQLKNIRAEPKNVNAHKALAGYYEETERFEEALDAMEEANKLTGGGDPAIESAISKIHLRIYDYNIRVLREAGKEEEAVQTENERAAYLMANAEKKVKKYPNDLGFKFDYGKLLYDKGLYNEAIEQFQRARNNPKRRMEALYYMGRCFRAKNQFDIAAEQISTALSELHVMNETKKNLHYELGEIYEAINQHEQALENYKAIYSVDIGFKDVAQKIEQGYPGKAAE